MVSRQLALLAGVLAFCVTANFSLAHHGVNTYETDRLTSLQGTVTGFEFVNPHVRIQMAVKEPDGQVELWTIEVAPPTTLRKVGWTKDTVKPNDPISVTGYRARDGSRILMVRRIVLPNSKELNRPPK